MKRIAEGLWQASAMRGFEIPKEAEVVFWLCGNAPKKHHALSTDRTLIDFEIPDDPTGLPDAVFQDLVEYARDYKDAGIITVCAMGENRSGLMSALVLIARGVPVEEAIATVQQNGNVNSLPAETKGHSFWNAGFAEQVRRYYQNG